MRLNQPPDDRKRGAVPIPYLPSILDRNGARAAGISRRASPDAVRGAEPGDLVARALAVLAEETSLSDRSRSVSEPPRQHVLSNGTVCRFPIRYFDSQGLIAIFQSDFHRADALTKYTGLQAVRQEDGKAVVMFGCFEYRRSDLGPYNEVGLCVLATAPGDPEPANYVVDLPVTTALANLAGHEIWGYNKFVAGIEIRRDGKLFSMTLRDPENATICELQVTRAGSVPVPPSDLPTFSLLDGRVIRTIVRMLTRFHSSGGDGFVLKVGASRHPMADHLRTLELDSARPALVQYADPFQGLLFPGRAV
jgi:hypothetical protein